MKKQWLAPFAKGTQGNYRRHFNRLKRWTTAANKKIIQLTSADLHRYADHLQEEGLGANVRYLALATIKSFFGKYAHPRGYVKRNPALGLPTPKRTRKRQNPVISKEDLALLLPTCKQMGIKYVRLVALMYFAGLRVHEAVKVKGKHFAADPSRLHVKGKGGTQKTVFLSKECMALLGALPRKRYLFPSLTSKKGHITRRTAHNWLKSACKKTAGASDRLAKASPHWLRHSICTHMAQAGKSLQACRDHLRHANVSQTDAYLHGQQKCEVPEGLLDC